MIALIIATHGFFSREIVKSSEMIFGKQDNLEVVTFDSGENVEELTKKYYSVMKKLDVSEGVLFMVDLFGGSPFNAASRIALEHSNVEIISGINLPMLLEVYGLRKSCSISELADAAKHMAIEGIKSFKGMLNLNIEEEL